MRAPVPCATLGPMDTLTRITAFEVAPEDDQRFIATWESGRGATLHRALRRDVVLRFVELAPDAGANAAVPFVAHPGRYEVVHEDGDPDGAGGAVLINPFDVPARDDERFLAGWRRVRDLLAARHGYLGTRLHRAVAPADFRFVNIARWSSPLMFARAREEPAIQRAAADLGFRGQPALYEVASHKSPAPRPTRG
jgi:heme oxygenase (mycobilin-producing)